MGRQEIRGSFVWPLTMPISGSFSAQKHASLNGGWGALNPPPPLAHEQPRRRRHSAPPPVGFRLCSNKQGWVVGIDRRIIIIVLLSICAHST